MEETKRVRKALFALANEAGHPSYFRQFRVLASGPGARLRQIQRGESQEAFSGEKSLLEAGIAKTRQILWERKK